MIVLNTHSADKALSDYNNILRGVIMLVGVLQGSGKHLR
uniref:Uncharacterized protein n=1 Tax=Candidatus Kentrum sp. FW TaxID=2126338 RepID=A0A450SAF7_9GAMM|nr:MAG: hypothetical protein BECKFW1821B_GA0114236_100167 [Candidatus Kentron sp. FW]VFJ49002.1 MAG: hypothetical protein BECKFW1821A_GA0114235_102129 [Candidatus Kentron sp. FW]